MAQKISEVRAELEGVQEAYTEALDDLTKLIDAVRREHDDWHVRREDGVFRWCSHAVCRCVGEIEYAYSDIIAAQPIA